MVDAVAAPVTFEALNMRHIALLEAQADERLEEDGAQAFVHDAAAAGAQIESVNDRDAVRSMINYWSATLARLPKPADPETTPSPAPAQARPVSTAPQPSLASFDASQSPTLDESANPFVGLAAFDVTQAMNFFGRDKVVRDLLQHVIASPVVVVSGGSGTGKSSLVRAGLIRALAEDPQTRDWRVVMCTPGRDPISSLAHALAPSEEDSSAWIEEARNRIDADPAAAAGLANVGAGLVLVVDQTEELFSLALPEQRDRATTAIASIGATPGARVVITIRDEYLEGERAQRVLPTLDLAGADEFRVPPLDPADIRAAIIGPATRAGLVFQDGLVDRIVADVGTDPAALPLLQYSLLRLWRRRQGNRITLRTYEEVGGPALALANAAQEVYDGFGSTQARENTRVIFEQLVRPSLVYEFVRDRVTRGELERLLPPQSIATVLQPFVDAALIRITRGAERSEDRIEIVHEALIRNWDPLRRWSNEVRDRERTFLSLDAQAQRWIASRQALGHLLFGRALSEAEATRDDYRQRARIDSVSDARVTAFLTASRATQRRLWTTAALIATVIATLALAALMQRMHAQSETKRAQALSGEVKGLSTSAAALSEEKASLESQALAGGKGEVARQFLQMLLSRGTVRRDELPSAYGDMTPVAADYPAGSWRRAFEAAARDGYPELPPSPQTPGLVRLDLPNMRVFYDTAHGLPVLVIALARRSTGWPAAVNSLYRWPGLAGQPDEEALARQGLMLGRLLDGRDFAWGSDERLALRAPNLLATMVPVRPSGEQAFAQWPSVGLWMRLNHQAAATRVLFLTGAVASPTAGNGAPPARLWAIAASFDPQGRVVTDAATLPALGRVDASDNLVGRTSPEVIAKLTGLDFGALFAAALPPPPTRTPLTKAMPAPPPPAPAAAAAITLWIHAPGIEPAQLDAVQAALSASSFRLPGVERNVSCVSTPQLRYYFPVDAAQAARAASVAGEALDGQNVVLRRLDPKRYPKARPGTIELWICGGGGKASKTSKA